MNNCYFVSPPVQLFLRNDECALITIRWTRLDAQNKIMIQYVSKLILYYVSTRVKQFFTDNSITDMI